MADAAVQFLLENLQKLLLYNVQLIRGVKPEVEALHVELSELKAFLEDFSAHRSDQGVVKNMVGRIRNVAYDAEDAIDEFLIVAAVHQSRKFYEKLLHSIDYPKKLRQIAQEILKLRDEVKGIRESKFFDLGALQGPEPGPLERRPPVVEVEHVVGFDKEAETLVNLLTGEARDLEVVSIVGMAGLGKTTLAKKIYNDPTVNYKFSTLAWIYVSQQYRRKDVFRSLLRAILKQIPADFHDMDEEELAKELRDLLSWNYLIVVDDVWTKTAWDDLKEAFPDQKNGSRVLLTSRNRDVAVHANPDREPHDLKYLTAAESWELLHWKVFRRGSCLSELVGLGRLIAGKCDGLPLAIVVIAGVLQQKPKTVDWWEKVANKVGSYVASDEEKYRNVLALSYNNLPYHLKACFVYFGIFPQDYEIPVWKLTRLWIAEGFIQKVDDGSCIEEQAEEFLEDLVSRNLVMVGKRSSSGRIKTCRIHDMLRDLCLKEAREENFFQEVKWPVQVPPVPSLSTLPPDKFRRICIHSNVLNYIASKPSGPRVRSFWCFNSQETNLPDEYASFVTESYKLLRVLDAKPVHFSRFPSEMKQLIHMRYIAISGNFSILPAFLSNLWNLQTLIVDTMSRSLQIKADIWKMSQLRHLNTNKTSHLHGPPAKERKDHEDPFVRRNLQTLSNISPDSCTENVLARTPNIKKLGIRGRLALLMEERGGASMFDNLAKLDQLASLKLLNDTFPRPSSEGKLLGLPQLYRFPPNLKKLTLSDTWMDWQHMSILGMLPKLQVLKLRDNAFVGPQWQPLDGGFRQLQVLTVGKTDLVTWRASPEHFPRLQRVGFNRCAKLDALPSGLAGVISLQVIELYWTSASAAASARQIQQARQQGNVSGSGFKLLIYPPADQ